MRTYFIIILLLVITTIPALAQNCKYLEEGQKSPNAQLSEIQWLAGHWHGESFGGIIEEIWTREMGGAMMGSFRMIMDNKVSFYELMTISEVENTIMLKIKHFDKDLKGWEAKDESVEFKLVELTPNAIYFEGLTMKKISKNELNIYVVIDKDGKKEEAEFVYERLDD